MGVKRLVVFVPTITSIEIPPSPKKGGGFVYKRVARRRPSKELALL